MNFPHKGLVTRKMSPFDDVIMISHNRLELHIGESYFNIGLTMDLNRPSMKSILRFANHHLISPTQAFVGFGNNVCDVHGSKV